MVGIGPGAPEHRTHRAEAAIRQSDVVVGYSPYVESIRDLVGEKKTITSGMMQEVQRCRAALAEAVIGKVVSLVSSGDPGIYGMAGLAIELAEAEGLHVPIKIVPGMTAASAAAAALGAPLMLDFAVISLSDLLVPWATIRTRVEAVAAADMVAVLYNPRSKKRVKPFEETVGLFLKHRPGTTPVGVVTAAGCEDEVVHLTDLDHLLTADVGMRSVVIVANSSAKVIDGKLVTARGYSL